MSYDELELDRLGDEKSALFFLISDTDTTYNFIVALAFSQMFNRPRFPVFAKELMYGFYH